MQSQDLLERRSDGKQLQHMCTSSAKLDNQVFITTLLKKDWIMTSADWVNAFLQAKLKKPIFMHIPRGFRNKYGRDGCLKLGRSLHGSKFVLLN